MENGAERPASGGKAFRCLGLIACLQEAGECHCMSKLKPDGRIIGLFTYMLYIYIYTCIYIYICIPSCFFGSWVVVF